MSVRESLRKLSREDIEQHAARVIAAGADTLVAGSAVYGAEDVAGAIAALRG